MGWSDLVDRRRNRVDLRRLDARLTVIPSQR
jgi:hypothetical protein